MLLSYKQCIEKYGNAYQIKKAIKEGKLFLLEAGIYSDKKYESELSIITMKYPKAVVTLNTAFYYYNLTDTIPDKYYLMTDRGAAKIRDSRVIQVFENSECAYLGMVTTEYNGRKFQIFNKERMLVELLRNKNKLPFDYYKEILLNYRKIIDELDMPEIQDYIYALPKSRMIMEILQLEVL